MTVMNSEELVGKPSIRSGKRPFMGTKPSFGWIPFIIVTQLSYITSKTKTKTKRGMTRLSVLCNESPCSGVSGAGGEFSL